MPPSDLEVTEQESEVQADGEGGVPVNELEHKLEDRNQSFIRLYCNAICFYHRVISIIFSHNPYHGRALRALNFATQMVLIPAIICVANLYAQSDYLLLKVFLLMRLIQLSFSLGLARGESTSKIYAAASIVFLLLINITAQTVILLIAPKTPFNTLIRWQTSISVSLELLVWDSLLMPLCLATGGKITDKLITRFTALMC